jgi:ATP-dependent DNA helicase UvrD/PcrA
VRLSPAQWSVVRYDSNALVTSVPGAGKTRIVQAKAVQEAARLVGLPISVACLTYTNAAADELRRRILPVLREEARERAYIGTLHSFCIQEILAPHAGRLIEFSNGHAIATPEDPRAEAIIQRLIGHPPTSKDLRRFGDVSRDANGAALPHEHLSKDTIETYWARLIEAGLIDFSGVMFYSAILLDRYPDVAGAVAASFSWFIVDEYQDTSRAQVRILRSIALAGSTKWLLIGDFNQSIFGFNGVSEVDLREFSRAIGAKEAELKRTYRCPPAIVRQARNLIASPPIQSARQEPSGIVYTVEGPTQHCVAEYVTVLGEHTIPPSRAAIIAPFRWMLSEAQLALSRSIAIPWSPQFRFQGRTTVSNCVCELLAYAHHDDTSHYLGAIAEINALLNGMNFHVAEVDVGTAVLAVVDLVKGAGLASASLQATAPKLFASVSAIIPSALHARLEEVFELSLRPSILEGSPLSDWSGVELAHVSCRHDAITLATIHGAKGLEFDGVLFLGFEAGFMPFSKSDDYDEELRKAYVTVTRSSNLLMYGYGRGKASPLVRQALGSS